MRGIDRRGIGRLEEVLADDVEGALARGGEIAERVLWSRKPAGEPEGKERGLVVDEGKVGEGGEVGGGTWNEGKRG